MSAGSFLAAALANGIPVSGVYGLFIELGAHDHQLEFPVIYANAKAGTASTEAAPSVPPTDLGPLFDNEQEVQLEDLWMNRAVRRTGLRFGNGELHVRTDRNGVLYRQIMQALVEGYLSERHLADVESGCPVAALVSEVPHQALGVPSPMLAMMRFAMHSWERVQSVSYTHLTLPTNREV